MLIGVTIFSGVLINSSTHLSDATGGYQGKFGSIILFELYKTPTHDGGFSAGITFHLGIICYLLLLLVIGALLAIVRINKKMV